jgi:hypothetical protein
MIYFGRDVLETPRELKGNWEIGHQEFSCTRVLLPDCIPRTDAWKSSEKPYILEARELIRGVSENRIWVDSSYGSR